MIDVVVRVDGAALGSAGECGHAQFLTGRSTESRQSGSRCRQTSRDTSWVNTIESKKGRRLPSNEKISSRGPAPCAGATSGSAGRSGGGGS